MSSMLRASTSLLLLVACCISVPAMGQDGAEWDRARAQFMTTPRGSMASAIDRWKWISSTDRLSFSEYSSFLLTFPGFPEEAKIKGWAEKALEREVPDYPRLVTYFDRVRPASNPAKAQYALALAAARRPEARDVAIEAWRGGTMSDAAAAALWSQFGSSFTSADYDARMNALLWAGSAAQTQQVLGYTSPAARTVFTARLAMLQGQDPESLGVTVTPDMLRDPGFVYNRVRQYRQSGNSYGAISLLATRPQSNIPALDPTRWIGEMLNAARGGSADTAMRIALLVDDAFPAGTDVSKLGFKLRDDYTSLMWLGGTKALFTLGDGPRAAALFYRYGAAAKTPGTRSKGFYWAGRALALRGDRTEALRYFEMAAAYPDQFYGLLALERLGKPVPDLTLPPIAIPTAAERQAFTVKPITGAVREVSRDFDWQTSVRFFREISDQAESEGDHLLVIDLARTIGRRDLAVIAGQAAQGDGFGNFRSLAFPLIPTPPGTDWTAVHMITRQESQFAYNAISHAGARGLMQLMPGTAREQAVKFGMAYDSSALIYDAGYNIRLGDGYFARMMDYFGGSYPLAVAAYNAGPGNVNKWLRSNGDPRIGSIDWIDWIERIPLQETRNYVQRVLENAVVYEAMNPSRARYRGSNPLSHFLGKRNPG